MNKDVKDASTMQENTLGVSGAIAKFFQATEITPLIALVGLLLGLFAVLITPREEEPQIKVTFANVFIAFPGASAKEVEMLVTTPAEQIASEIVGVKHIYSISSPGISVLTVRFEVGRERTDSIVKLYNAFYSNMDWLPAHLGVMQPIIKPMGIDDVPIVAVTLWSEAPEISGADLTRIANTLETDLNRVPGTRDVIVKGASEHVLQVKFDPVRLSGFNLALSDVRQVLNAANASSDAGELVNNNALIKVQAGTFLSTAKDVADLVIGIFNNAPVFLRDVADVSLSVDQPAQYHSFGVGVAWDDNTEQKNENKNSIVLGQYPAVTLSVAKKTGENAVEVANHVIDRLQQLRGISLPDNVNMTVTRNYGETAQDKAQTLIKKLLFATVSVIVLVLLTLGRREAVVVGAAVVVTLAITLFTSWAWGFTLNRVSLFALIFSIGILVDDAIVVVENIHRHMQLGGKSLRQVIPIAVDEVGGPTILATFTVIAALLPMAFVTGLMGPYMRPIPINASSGMLISLAIAFIFTPWLYRALFEKSEYQHSHDSGPSNTNNANDKLHYFFDRSMRPFLAAKQGLRNRWLLLAALLGLIVLSMATISSKLVILKMLPFDNKSEFQIIVDMPEGTPLENTHYVLQEMAQYIETVPEVIHYQIYTGSSAPINFNGLVRQYYLRSESNMGDIQVNLLDKKKRHRKSHEIALSTREALTKIAKKHNAVVKIVEVPPGPPVLAPLVAEVYGLDTAQQTQAAKKIATYFSRAADVVDIDTSIESSQDKLVVSVDRSRSAQLGVSQADIAQTIQAALAGEDMSFLHDQHVKNPIPISVELPSEMQSEIATLQDIKIRANNGNLIPLSEVSHIHIAHREQSIQHKDLQTVVYVTGDVAGNTDSPLYGLFDIYKNMNESEPFIQQYFVNNPEVPYTPSIKWDGEWQVTYETFRDMGIAYGFGLVLIYLLVVAQFRSYGLPLIIMAPIPLTMIGILPGHAIIGQQFTAPSMIGMIALAGIIVRNSILLVDFIQQQVQQGMALQEATIAAAAVRARPIVLTAIAAMLGGFFILDDPIFGGLAVSLIFGLLVSTLLTLFVIPVVYYHYFHKISDGEEVGHGSTV